VLANADLALLAAPSDLSVEVSSGPYSASCCCHIGGYDWERVKSCSSPLNLPLSIRVTMAFNFEDTRLYSAAPSHRHAVACRRQAGAPQLNAWVLAVPSGTSPEGIFISEGRLRLLIEWLIFLCFPSTAGAGYSCPQVGWDCGGPPDVLGLCWVRFQVD